MREFDDIGLQLSIQQANMFVEMNKLFSGSSYALIKTFMNSNCAFRIDSNLSIDTSDVISEMSNYKIVNKGKQKINSDVIYWIGYLYRYWAYVFEESSKKIYSIIQAEELEKLYNSYHTLDPKMAIERIYESKNIQKKDSLLDIMKKIYLT